jgi:hypothetical protein
MASGLSQALISGSRPAFVTVDSIGLNKKGDILRCRLKILQLFQAIRAQNAILEHTKRGVIAQIHFCESSQSVATKKNYTHLFKDCNCH